MIDVKGRIITTDAMGCQKEIASRIVEKKGDYVFCLKGNQESLHDDVKFFFNEAREADFQDVEYRYFETIEKDHGRIETRQNLAILMRIALNIVKREQTQKKVSVRCRVKKAGWDNPYLEQVLVS